MSGAAALAVLAGIVLTGMLSVTPLAAQDRPEGPISLFPPTVVAPEGPDTPQNGAQEGPPGAAPSAPAPVGTAPETPPETPQYEGIQVDRLQELDTESLGILEADSGGLGVDAWAGSDRALVAALIRSLPGDPASPTLRALTTRLLLSNARAPGPLGGGAPAGGPTLADAVAGAQGDLDGGFLRLRAERLHAMGELAGLNRLLSIVPQRAEDSWLAQARVDGLLLAGRDQEACSQVRSAVARFAGAAYWGQALVFCQLLAEQRDQAFLGLDLLREEHPDADPVFYALSNLFIGGTVAPPAPEDLTPLTLAMLRLGEGTPPEGLAERAAPLLLHGIAALDSAAPADKAGAAERLVQAAVLPGNALTEAYDAVPFESSELDDPLVRAEALGGVRGRALLVHAAGRETLAQTKAEYLQAALLAAERDGRGFAMARAVQAQLEQVAPAVELAWFAGTAARSLYRVGGFERAGAWAAVLRLDGAKNPESLAAFAALNPLMRLAGGTDPIALGPITSAEGAEGAQDPEAGARLLTAMMLSRALGQDERAWPGVAEGAGSADAVIADEPLDEEPLERLTSLLALSDAAVAGRSGEAALLASHALGDESLGGRHPLALAYAVSALRSVGLGGDARALALEAALDAGL
ncbi:hypothetical protein [Pelagibius sp.]|uniref:hypothetical protein n=1 Tax=Pelagibius sp. TaxID=1931238 RepID=UPI002636B40F|nr:hypothetical protein [Pelagibius sp.]